MPRIHRVRAIGQHKARRAQRERRALQRLPRAERAQRRLIRRFVREGRAQLLANGLRKQRVAVAILRKQVRHRDALPRLHVVDARVKRGAQQLAPAGRLRDRQKAHEARAGAGDDRAHVDQLCALRHLRARRIRHAVHQRGHLRVHLRVYRLRIGALERERLAHGFAPGDLLRHKRRRHPLVKLLLRQRRAAKQAQRQQQYSRYRPVHSSASPTYTLRTPKYCAIDSFVQTVASSYAVGLPVTVCTVQPGSATSSSGPAASHSAYSHSNCAM